MGGGHGWDGTGVFESEEEIAKIAEYPNIRMFRLNYMTAKEPQDDLMSLDFTSWARPNEVDQIKKFSAVCLLTIKYMADVLGKNKADMNHLL